VTGGCRKLQNEQLQDLHISTNVIIKSKKTRWAGHVARMDNRNTYLVLFGKTEGNRSLGRIRHRWKHSIQTDLKQTGREGWIHLSQDRTMWWSAVNTVMSFRVP
jgi:hypothetical protein